MERRRILVVAAALVAVLGVVLVLLYVRGSDTRAKEQYAMTRVLVATQTITQGETFGDAVKSGKLDLQDVVSSDKVTGAISSLTAISDSEVAQSSIYPGEQVLGEKFSTSVNTKDAAAPTLQIPAGDVAISVALTDPGRVAGFVEPGSSVVIFATAKTGPTAGDWASGASRVVVPKVLVLGVGSTAPGASNNSDASDTSSGTTAPAETLPNTLLTVAVTQEEAERIRLVENDDTPSYVLTFGLLSDKSTIKPGQVIDHTNLFAIK